MKTLVYKYFDEFCFSELIADDEDSNWFKPNMTYQAFGYQKDSQTLFYNGKLLEEVLKIFDISQTDFIRYYCEWFENKYGLSVSNVA